MNEMHKSFSKQSIIISCVPELESKIFMHTIWTKLVEKYVNCVRKSPSCLKKTLIGK